MSKGSRGTSSPSSTTRSIKRHLVAGLALVLLVVGGVGGWAAKTEIAGAVIAAGSIVVDSNVKKVQHQAGGTVGEILVRNGDRVQAGDVLIKLDTTIATARLAIIQKRLLELQVRQARLWAERDGSQSISTPAMSGVGDVEGAVVLAAERRLFELRKRARLGQKQQLRQRVGQLEAEVEGLTAQVKAKVGEIALMQQELQSARVLWGKKLMSISRITALEREATRLEGQRAQLVTRIAATKGRIAETELKVIQIDRDLASEVARELRQIDAALGELVERRVASQDQLRRMTIRAPQAGLVHQSQVHTVGGVIGAGETVMLVVPTSETLTIEAQVAPKDIDQLWVGQNTLLRFSAFNQRTTPELEGKVDSISADITVDEKSGKRFYTARVSVSAREARRLGGAKLVPGMPVETFIKTGDRTVMSYLMKPLADQANRAFRE